MNECSALHRLILMERKKERGNVYHQGQQTQLENAIFLFLEGFTWQPQRRTSYKGGDHSQMCSTQACGESGQQMGEPAAVLCWLQARAQHSPLAVSHPQQPHQVMGCSWPGLPRWAEVSGQGYNFLYLTRTTPLFRRAMKRGRQSTVKCPTSLILSARLLNVHY